jgi:acyl transferase domain-containing protein/acyl carrier protein/SAM-dependent methyltransferase
MPYTVAALEAELPGSEMNDLVTEIVAASLRCIGLLSGGVRKIADLSLEKQPAPYYERWLSRSIVYLQQQGFLDDHLAPKRDIRALPELWNEWEAKVSAWASNPNQQAQGALLKACLEGLPAILSGRQRATDVMFPNSSMHLVEGVYRGNPQADYFNDVLGRTLTACIEQQLQADPERRLRILEIGAGTGGTTAALLPLLEPYPVEEYCYTDLSKAFLMHAEKNFKPNFSALTTAIFDVSKPLESQTVAPNHYDFAIAANVLHATADIRETLRNAKATLRNQGVLLLNEIAEWTMFNHLTFGLLEGWWLYEDAAVRLPGSPGLSPEKWREILAEEGFASVLFPAEEAHRLGQQIVAAVSNGRTRQRIAKHVVQPAPEAAPPRQPRAASAVSASQQATADHVRRIITAKLSDSLRMDAASIQADASFADYGVDSIIGVNLVRTISEALEIDLEPTTLFEYSTVDDLTGYVLNNWRDTIAARMPEVQSAPEAPRPAMEPARPTAEERPVRGFVGATRFANVQDPPDTTRKGGPDHFGVEPIAIIGMSGRFAESESLEAFWHHLSQGDDLVRPVSRWSEADCVISGTAGQGYCSHGSFIDSIDRFDPAFFGISPLEATYMDPQQRLFLEESWSALEDAGHAGKSVHEKQCGVYVGCGSSQYDRLFADAMPAQAFWGNSQSVTSARIAYCLNLQGPAITIDTACSSSLVAIHLACQGLWARETDMAMAGGVFLQPTPGFYQVANRAGMLSSDGKCYSFDARANGFVPGEGVGVVVLKRLRDALMDRDHIHGVIAGSGINQDGKSNGLIAPNGRAQERLERAVYDRFKIGPDTIQVVEAHGTGTLLGDSVEYGAISRAFREHTDRKQFCALGTVKTNIGHASTAAGVAGVLKILLSLKHRQIPPSLHFDKGNPTIDLEEGPFYVNTRLREWEVDGNQTRRAAVSSFGFSGTNAHLVIEEAPAVVRAAVEAPAYLVVLSARSAEQVKQQARDLAAHLERNPEMSMMDASFSLFVGRMHRSHRLTCVARNRIDLIRALGQWVETGIASQVHTGEMHEGKFREQVSLKKFGNYCIQECRNAQDAAGYIENLEAVAELYVQGYSLDFQSLFPKDARRVPLPTYPFARERYWLDVVRDGVGSDRGSDRVSAAAPAAIVSATVAARAERPSVTPSAVFAGTDGDLRPMLQSDLSDMVRELLNLGTVHVPADKVLIDLGFDSLGLTSFAKAINDRYRLDITPVLFFDYPSVSEIARYLSEEQGSRIANTIVRPAAPRRQAPIEPPSEPQSEPRSFSAERRFVDEPIAIVGIAGVMPQSEDLDALWSSLRDGKDLITVIPEERWPWEDYYGDPLREVNKSNSKWGGFMKEIDKFDSLFFGISPREAQMMDPQQRIFLETVWKAIEDSGQKVSDLAGTRTGLFVGVGSNDYLDVMRNRSIALDGYTASGNSHSVLANRVSFLLNLRGPSSPIDTACSSSLVALHRAIESIHTRSSDMAIVGGVQVIMSPGAYISFGMAGMLSGDGKCRTFDKRANGYVRGEGCGAMLLKPLSRAEADGNHVYAVIKATSENHGGRVTTMIAPNSAAQAALLIEAYEKAQIDPATVGYIECHGTGTSLGDPIEVLALSKAFSELYARRGKAPGDAPHCGLGTVKTNIGHLETAAGVAGVLKVLLALKHGELPANVHFEELNPHIRLEGTPFYIVDKLTPWKAMKGEDGSVLPRRAGVSSFGFGGANAHAVLEEYIPVRRESPAGESVPQLIVLSAKNEDRLLAYVHSMCSYVERYDGDLVDLAYTLQVGRDEMPERLALVASNKEELKRKLDEVLSGDHPEGSYRGDATNGSVDETLVRAAIERKELLTIAELWVAGARIEWRRLHEPALPRRISAPTYPFARERYWLPGDTKKAPTTGREDGRESLQTFAPAWSRARIDSDRNVSVPESDVVLLLGSDRDRLDWVRRSYPRADLAEIDAIGDRSFDQLLWIAPDSEGQEQGVLSVFRAIKALLRSGHAEKNVQWTIITSRTQQVTDGEPVRPAHAGIAGLVGSLAKEYPHWSLRLLDVDSLASVTARGCLSLPWDKQGNGLAHRGGEWFQQALTPAAVVPRPSKSSYRQSGVYVVIGGAGGIGEVWSRFMIERYQANVVWIGRRPCDAAIEEKIDALSRLGAAPLYIPADATNLDALAQARDAILKVYPAIHGVVHSALVLHDQSIAGMEEAAFRSSLSAKVDVAMNLDRVFGSDELDFMLFFSSIVSFVRPAGQCNYTAGCVFKDSFAQMLQQQRPYPVKTMNWGYWGNVGVAADDAHRRNMARVGLGSIEPEEGMAALEALMSADMQQVALIKTVNSAAAVAATPGPRSVAAGPITADRVRQTIIELLCEELRLQPSAIRHDAAMSDYGVDSIVGVNLVRGLSETLRMPLEPSSLFDYGTVNRLTGYIVERATGATAPAAEGPALVEPADPLCVDPSIDLREESGEQLLDALLWGEAASADSYEKVTF